MTLPVTDGSATSSAEPSTDSGASADTTAPLVGVDVLLDAGIQVVTNEEDAADPSHPLRLTSVQAERLAADTMPGSGMWGWELDLLAPVPAGTPSASFLVAAWVSTGTSTSAATARQWMGDSDWTTAPDLRFPLAAVAIFVNEMATDTSVLPASTEPVVDEAGASTDPDDSAALAAGFARRPAALPAAPCSAVSGFLGSVFDGLFNALKINPATNGGGVLDTATSVLATVWNAALGLAQGTVQGLITTLTAPVFNAVRVAVGALGVATVVVSYFKDQSLDVGLQTPQSSPDQYPFAVGGGPDTNGTFVAKSRELTGGWPQALTDCAQVANAPLPQLVSPGSPANWTVDGSGLIVPGPLQGLVGPDNTATLTFVTGRESEEDAAGEAVHGVAYVTVSIPRSEVQDFLSLAKAQIDGAKAQMLSLIPPALQPAVSGMIASTIDPTIAQVANSISGAVGGPLAVQGSSRVIVVHHNPPDTTLPAPLPSEPPGDDVDFCTQYVDMSNWILGTTPGNLSAFGAELVRRLQLMRPSAPAELLGSVDTLLGIYGALAAGADALSLADQAGPLGEAAAVLGGYCGLSGG